MQLLLCGGTEELRRSIIKAVVSKGHRLRLVAPNAERAAKQWPAQVEPWRSLADDSSALAQAIAGCDAVIALATAGLIRQGNTSDRLVCQLPGLSGDGGGRRFIYVSAVPAANDACLAEVRKFSGDWLVVRVPQVYGVGDDLVSLLLIMMRSLPAVPIAGSDRPFQPLWHGDLANALVAALALESSQINRSVEMVGPDPTTLGDLYERIARLIDRRPLRVPVPQFLAAHGARLAEALKLTVPLQSAQLTALLASDDSGTEGADVVSSMFGVAPTGLQQGLEQLINGLDEQIPFEGVGTLEIKRFSVDIRGSHYSAPELVRRFRAHFKDVMPVEVGVEPASPATMLTPGVTLTLALPGRGHVQVRVEQVDDQEVTIATLRGHALAGVVRFAAQLHDGAIRFEVMTCDTAANPVDWMTLTLGGARLQDANWGRVLQNVAKLAGGKADEVQADMRDVTGEEAVRVNEWIGGLIQARRASEPV